MTFQQGVNPMVQDGTTTVTYCSQTAFMIVLIQLFLVSWCNISLWSSRKSAAGRTMPATYADAFAGTYNRHG